MAIASRKVRKSNNQNNKFLTSAIWVDPRAIFGRSNLLIFATWVSELSFTYKDGLSSNGFTSPLRSELSVFVIPRGMLSFVVVLISKGFLLSWAKIWKLLRMKKKALKISLIDQGQMNLNPIPCMLSILMDGSSPKYFRSLEMKTSKLLPMK